MKGFKEFITRGNLVELAVAFIMGAAFNTVVKAFTDLIMGVVSKIIGGEPNFDNVAVGGVAIGPFISATINFLLVAAVLYFFIVKPFNKFNDWLKKSKEEEPKEPTDVELLTQIRDLLAKDAPSNDAVEA